MSGQGLVKEKKTDLDVSCCFACKIKHAQKTIKRNGPNEAK